MEQRKSEGDEREKKKEKKKKDSTKNLSPSFDLV